MKAEKESKITVDMNINEAEILVYSVSRILSGGLYKDVLPDNKKTEKTLKDFMSVIQGLI